jgi:hypothetical protein
MGLLISKYKIFFAAAMMLCGFLFPVLAIAAGSSASKPLPALPLSGTLDDTPQTVTLCAPLNIRYSVGNTGAIAVSNGQLTIEIKAAATGQLVFARILPFTMGPDSLMLDNVDFPQGEYAVTLKASAPDPEHQSVREDTLDEQTLTVSAPILVKKGNSKMLRVLVWLNRTGPAVHRVFAEKILKQAFEDDGVYYTTVDSAEDFTNQALSGVFNVAVLFEPDELLDQSDWLMDRITLGQGLVLIGSENKARMIAETFGFKFSETLTTAGAMLQLTEDSGMELSGTIPVSGRILLPRKKDATATAVFADDKRPAMLIDKAEKGRVIVMPFSLTRSAQDTGLTSLYSLLLRAAVQSAALENDEQAGISSSELLVSAPSGSVRTHVVETLPAETRVIWTNAGGTVKNNTIFYDLIADKEPRKLLYVCRPPAGNKTPAFTEVFYECNEKFVSQGKLE